MSGYWISSQKEKRPLTVKELRDFFNEIESEYDDDYLSMSDREPFDKVMTYIQVMGLRSNSAEPLTTDWMTNPYIYEYVECNACGIKSHVRRKNEDSYRH